MSWVVATTARSGARYGSACRARTALFPMATTYSTPAASRWAKISGVAKPASSRTRSRAPGNARQSFGSSRCSRLDRAGRPRGVAGAEDRGDEVLPRLVVKGQGAHERQIAPVIVEAIEEGQLLRAVGLVFGDIEIDRDQPDAASAAAMPGNHRVGERVAHGEQHPRGGRVLEARDRRLRRQAAAVDRIAPQQQFVDRIVGEPVGVIAVGMATRDREDALRDQIADAVRHARRTRAHRGPSRSGPPAGRGVGRPL